MERSLQKKRSPKNYELSEKEYSLLNKLPTDILKIISSSLNPNEYFKFKNLNKDIKNKLYNIYDAINENNIDYINEREIKSLPSDILFKFAFKNPNVKNNTFIKVVKLLTNNGKDELITQEILSDLDEIVFELINLPKYFKKIIRSEDKDKFIEELIYDAEKSKSPNKNYIDRNKINKKIDFLNTRVNSLEKILILDPYDKDILNESINYPLFLLGLNPDELNFILQQPKYI
jgi:hypothetical protein